MVRLCRNGTGKESQSNNRTLQPAILPSLINTAAELYSQKHEQRGGSTTTRVLTTREPEQLAYSLQNNGFIHLGIKLLVIYCVGDTFFPPVRE